MKIGSCFIPHISMLVALLLAGPLQAQSSLFSNAQFQNYTINNGLPSDNCFKTIQTIDGAIWVATMHGIGRYNGYQWQYFQQEQTNKSQRLPSNWVMDLSATKQRLWFHTDRGSMAISLATKKVIRSENLHQGWGKLGAFGRTVFCSSWRGIVAYSNENGVLKHPKMVTGSENQSCIQLLEQKKGIYGIQEDVKGYFQLIESKNAYTIRTIHTILLDGKAAAITINQFTDFGKTILVATAQHGLIHLDPKTNRARTLIAQHQLNSAELSHVLPYRINNHFYYILGTKGSGLICIDADTKAIQQLLPVSERPRETLASATIQHLFTDRTNGIWISTDKGLSYFHPSLQRFKATYFYRNAIIPENTAFNVCQEIDKQALILGTESDGAFIYNQSTQEAFKIPLPIENNWNTINAGCVFNDDLIFLGTGGGVCHYSPSKNQLEYLPKLKGLVLSLRKLNAHSLGIGTTAGALIWDLKTKQFSFIEKIDSSRESSEYFAKDLFLDETGKLWILRFFNGLERLDLRRNTREKFTPQTIQDKGTDFHNLTLSNNRKELIVSSTNGLFIVPLSNPKKARNINANNGLAGDLVERCIVHPNGKTIYYTTPTGLFRLAENEEKSYLLHPLEKYRQKWFNDLILTDNQELYATVSNAIVRYIIPTAKYSIPSKPTIENTTIDNQVVSSEAISLTSNQRLLNFQFSTKHFTENNEVLLEYRLKQLSEDWKPTLNGNIELVGLKAGYYDVEVRNRNQPTGKTSLIWRQSITIDSPFYSSWWFYALLTIGILSVGGIVFSFRLKTQARLLETRMQLSRDLHDELGANVSSIHIMASMLGNSISASDPAAQFAKNISTYSKQINETVNEIIWNVNPRFDHMEEVILRMKRFATETLEAAGVDLNFQVFNDHFASQIAQDTKYNIYLIFKECVNNCAKYSKAKNVKIHIQLQKNGVFFSLTDDGIGFDLTEKETSGNGLSNMFNRAKNIGGELNIKSTVGEGTTVSFKREL